MQNIYFYPSQCQPLYQQPNYQPIYQQGMQTIQPIIQRVPLTMGIPQMQAYPYRQQNIRQPILQIQPLGQGIPIIQGTPGIIRQPKMQGPPKVPLTEKGKRTILQPFQQYKPEQLPKVNTIIQQKPIEKKKKDLTPKYNLKEIVNNPNFHQQMRDLILKPNITTPKKEVKKRTKTKRKVIEKGKKEEDLKQVITPIQDSDDTITEDLTYIILDDTETEEIK